MPDTSKKAPAKKKKIVGSPAIFVRFPPDLHTWLIDYAATHGYQNAAELLRHIAREFRAKAEREEKTK